MRERFDSDPCQLSSQGVSGIHTMPDLPGKCNTRDYQVSTVGRDEQVIQRVSQEHEDKRPGSMRLTRYSATFRWLNGRGRDSDPDSRFERLTN